MILGECWIVYIPDYKVIKKMVIRGFDDGPDIEDIMKYLRPSPGEEITWRKPIKVERLKTRTFDREGNSTLTEGNTYIASFDSFVVPNKMVYNMRTVYLVPFISRVLRCARCQRYGHAARFCKSSTETCARCAAKGHSRALCTTDAIRCVNC